MSEPLGGNEAGDGGIDWRLLRWVLVAAVLFQVVVPLIRIATSYKALDLSLSAGAVGLISAAFALLPTLLAVAMGRFVDRGGSGKAAVLGAVLIGLSALGLWLGPPWLASLLLFTTVLGVGQTLCLTALHMFSSSCSGPARRDEVIGHFLLAFSVGQLIAPLLVSLFSAGGASVLGDRLLLVCCLGAGALLLAAMALGRHGVTVGQDGGKERVPVSQLLGSKGLVWVILASSMCVTTSDLLLVYLPVLGAERGMTPGMVGLLLTTRAIFLLLSRAVFARLARSFERVTVIVGSMLLLALALTALAFPLPAALMFAAMGAIGFAVGVATASSLSLTLALAPPGARGTMVSLRVTANRLGQFAIPLAAGLTATALGVGGIMLVMAALLGASAVSVRLSLRHT